MRIITKKNNEVVFYGTKEECQEHLDIAETCDYWKKDNIWETFSHRYCRLENGYKVVRRSKMKTRERLLRLLRHYCPRDTIESIRGKRYRIEAIDGSFSTIIKITFPIDIHHWINFKWEVLSLNRHVDNIKQLGDCLIEI